MFIFRMKVLFYRNFPMPQLDTVTFFDQSVLILVFFWLIYSFSRFKILPELRIMLFLRRWYNCIVELHNLVISQSLFFIKRISFFFMGLNVIEIKLYVKKVEYSLISSGKFLSFFLLLKILLYKFKFGLKKRFFEFYSFIFFRMLNFR